MPLTKLGIKTAKPGLKARRLFDGGGLYLEISPSGGKWWRYKYRYGGKEKRISLGVYPKVDLLQARANHLEARKLLDKGFDPSQVRKENKVLPTESNHGSFLNVACEWHQRNSSKWSKKHSHTIIRRLERDVFPWLGQNLISHITPRQVLACLRRIENRGAIETAHRVKSICGQVFRYAIAIGEVERDPTADLKGALQPVQVNHHASVTTTSEIAGLLRAIIDYHGHFVTKCALKLTPLVFVRPGELRKAEWNEVDLEKSEWRIPASKMKGGEIHIVPLSKQAKAILIELWPLTGSGTFLFPSLRSSTRPMSDNTINAALRRLGYTNKEMTAHGFRSLASTRLHEMGWRSDVIERQLAHKDRDSVRAAYNYAQHLEERRNMMQVWADYLEKLRDKPQG